MLLAIPTVVDPPSVELDHLPVLDEDDCCHVLSETIRQRTAAETACGAPYDCLPSEVCSAYNGQETCPDCHRVICPECERIMRNDGGIGGVRRKL